MLSNTQSTVAPLPIALQTERMYPTAVAMLSASWESAMLGGDAYEGTRTSRALIMEGVEQGQLLNVTPLSGVFDCGLDRPFRMYSGCEDGESSQRNGNNNGGDTKPNKPDVPSSKRKSLAGVFEFRWVEENFEQQVSPPLQ